MCCTWVCFDWLWVMKLRLYICPSVVPSCDHRVLCLVTNRMRVSTACYWLYPVGGMRMMSAHRLMPWRTVSSLIFCRSRLPASSTFRDLRQVFCWSKSDLCTRTHTSKTNCCCVGAAFHRMLVCFGDLPLYFQHYSLNNPSIRKHPRCTECALWPSAGSILVSKCERKALRHGSNSALSVSCWYSYVTSWPFFTLQKTRMRMNLDHVDSGHFVLTRLGRDVLCEFDYWLLAV